MVRLPSNNLGGTKVTDAGLLYLPGLIALHTVYLGGTKVRTPGGKTWQTYCQILRLLGIFKQTR